MADFFQMGAEFFRDGAPYDPVFTDCEILDKDKNSLATLAGGPFNITVGQTAQAINLTALGLSTTKLYFLRFNYTPYVGASAQAKDIGFIYDPFTLFQERVKDDVLYDPYIYAKSTLSGGLPDPVGDDTDSALHPYLITFRRPPISLKKGLYGSVLPIRGYGFDDTNETVLTLWHHYSPTGNVSNQKTSVLFTTGTSQRTNVYDYRIWTPPSTLSSSRGPRDGSSGSTEWASDDQSVDTGVGPVRERWDRPKQIFQLKFTDLLKAGYETWFRDWFIQHRGRSIPFLWKNWWDSGQVTGKQIGIGDGTNKIFNLDDQYLDYSASITLYEDGVSRSLFLADQGAGDDRVDYINGKLFLGVSGGSPPASGSILTIDYQRYTLVRFFETSISFTKTKEIAYDVDVSLEEVFLPTERSTN